MRLRVLDFGYQSALRSQAVYHGVAATLTPESDAVLTLVNPLDPYVCVGMHQEVGLEVDEEFCRGAKLPVVRRHVGGGAVYLDENQMFFHFIFPRQRMPGFVAEIYPRFIEPVVRTYRDLGVAASYRPINDIHVNGRKIGGTGAACIGDAMVMVGSFMFDFDTELMARCLKVPSEKFRDKLRTGLNDYMTTIRRELTQVPERDEVKARFLAHVEPCLDVKAESDEPSAAELASIATQERLLADPEWTYQVGRKMVGKGVKISSACHLTEGTLKAPGGLIRVRLLTKDGEIADLELSGDFTALPSSGVEALAEALAGAALEEPPLVARVEDAWRALELQIPGVEPAHVARAILGCVHAE